MNFIDELKARELFFASTEEKEVIEHLESGNRTFYIGFDPTSDSLHAGSLLPILTMARLQKKGHKPLVLVGGGTGMIGDPSGKSDERQLLDEETLANNLESMKKQFSRFLDFDDPETGTEIVNNYDWLKNISFIEFLRDAGKHFSVNQMIAKESVKNRLENREQGISYTEFSYMLMQAYDFYELFKEKKCTIQMGGSDQWGNITAGIDFIRKKTGDKAYGITVPLLTTSSGKKFGKSEAGTIWLDSHKTSPYQFYQFWIRTEDADVIRYLKAFTFLSLAKITELEAIHREKPHARVASTQLAEEMTRMVHGQEGLESARRATRAFFGGDLSDLTASELMDVFSDVPSYQIQVSQLAQGLSLVGILSESGFIKSKGQSRRMIKGGGIYLNNNRVKNIDRKLNKNDLIDEAFIVLRSGKKKYFLLKAI
ncbi:MAG: tyrosine--tRNA ligase [Myxococcota bacterium]